MSLITGFILDLIFGDPRGIPHIVVVMGRCISRLEEELRNRFPKSPAGERAAGMVLVLCMTGFSGVVFFALALLRKIPGPFAYIAESLLIWQLLAGKDLRKESMEVYRCLTRGDLPGARKAVSMIVGRDTEDLDETGVTRAAVETVAENTSDGVIAPLFYIALGGGGLGCLYKCINTMDSMVGYKNEKYLYFGWAAARLDDLFNFIPSRLSAWLMILMSDKTGFNRQDAERIYKRDRGNHESPNSAQTEAAMAGALGVELGGNAFYFGKLHEKPTIGDALRPIEPEDIKRANKLSFAASAVALAIAVLVRVILHVIF